MTKQNLFLDMDNTIINTNRMYCETYNLLYFNHPDFVPADWTKVRKWDYTDVCPLVDNKMDIFEEEYFFWSWEFLNDNTYDVLKELKSKYKITIVTIGTPKNVALKAKYIEYELPFIDDYVLLVNKGCKMNKSVVNMDNAIFLDDMPSNLASTNAKRKILVGKIFPWNNNWTNEHCLNWTEIRERLL